MDISRFVGTVILGIGVIAQGAAVYLAIQTREWITTTVQATGTCVGYGSGRPSNAGSRPGSGSRRSKAERIDFVDANGNPWSFVSWVSTSSPYKIGDTVPIRYHPQNPSMAAVDTAFRTWFPAGLVGVAGLGFTLAGWAFRRPHAPRR
jgi:hypothetical protein